MDRRLTLISLAVLLLTAAGCDVHEIPGEDPAGLVNLVLDLAFDQDLPQYQTIDRTTRAAAEDAPLVRYTVRLFPRVGDHYVNVPLYTFQEYGESLASRRLEVSVAPWDYKLVAWTDFVDPDTKTGWYDIDDFSAIRIPEALTAPDESHDAFWGEAELPFSAVREYGATVRRSVTLVRPLAQFNIISTDRQELVTRLLTKTGTRSEDIDLARYVIRIQYTQFLPDTFDALQNAPVGSRTGASFQTRIAELDSDEVELASDYVFVNGKESKVVVALTISDQDGQLLSTVSGIEIPLLRSHQTTVRGKFLTGGISSGIIVNPGFDGEYNIQI